MIYEEKLTKEEIKICLRFIKRLLLLILYAINLFSLIWLLYSMGENEIKAKTEIPRFIFHLITFFVFVLLYIESKLLIKNINKIK
tara:strand:+ start:525 stop:779 length:255 start_codon:yes stop_codon:yes gene_type:complete